MFGSRVQDDINGNTALEAFSQQIVVKDTRLLVLCITFVLDLERGIEATLRGFTGVEFEIAFLPVTNGPASKVGSPPTKPGGSALRNNRAVEQKEICKKPDMSATHLPPVSSMASAMNVNAVPPQDKA